MKLRRLFTAALSAAALYSGAAAGDGAPGGGKNPPPPVKEHWNLSAYERELVGGDPAEPFNRAMFDVNDFLLLWIFRPVGTVYGSIVPRPVILCFNNFVDNLEFPVRCFSSLLQGHWRDGGSEALRFLINTTVGLGGFFAPAEHWCKLHRADEDFGQAFASWGIPAGCRLVLPGVGKDNIRDLAGTIFDYACDPKSYFYGGQAFTFLNRGMTAYRQYEELAFAGCDRYESAKLLQGIYRRLQIENRLEKLRRQVENEYRNMPPPGGELPKTAPGRASPWMRLKSYQPRDPVADTLRMVNLKVRRTDRGWWSYLSFWSSDFRAWGKIRSVQVLPGRPELEFTYHPQSRGDKKAPLAFILPGLGSHHTSATAAAVAELLYDRDMATVTMSNPMNWAFHAAAGRAPFPGFTPADAYALREAMLEIKKYLRKEYDLQPEKIVLCGFSLGAIETLFIADLERARPRLDAARFVAVNPPVRLLTSLNELDRCAALYDTRENAMKLGMSAFTKYLFAVKAGAAAGGAAAFTNEEARLLIGLSFRQTLRELIFSMHRRQALPQLSVPYRWGRRTELYRELDRFGYRDYVAKLVIPAMAPGRTPDELGAKASLPVIEATLREDPRIRVLHTEDDMLLSEADREFLDRTLGTRLQWFSNGGHMGQMYRPEFQHKLMDFLVK